MLENKVVLVTGASRGIGRAVAMNLAAHGATVALLSRTISELESLHDQIMAAGHPQPCIVPFNLCNATLEDFDKLRSDLQDKYGRLDGLIHNAGILGSLTPISHYPIQTWYQVLQVNLNAAFILTQTTLPLLKAAKHSSIIFTVNQLGKNPKANWGAYAVANAGMHALVKMLAAEQENISNIRVNAVIADKIATYWRKSAYPAENTASLLLPEEIAEQYSFLISDASRDLNGAFIDLATVTSETV